MELLQQNSEADTNPVDMIEHVADIRDWSWERYGPLEIAIDVVGNWKTYQVSFSWLCDLEALHASCSLDMAIPENRQDEMTKLLARINERQLVGHLDYWPQDGVIMFRHTLLLSGGAQLTSQQIEGIASAACEACECHYQACQFVAWANKSAEEALQAALFETAGDA